MWVISYLLPQIQASVPPQSTLDFAEELLARQKREMEKQRIGLLGEQFILNSEKERLTSVGRGDLAKKVRLVAIQNEAFGYDILSFAVNGDEIHIEVKTTTQGQHDSDCFWLSANEVQKASVDPKWTVFRVWSIDANPFFEDLGNIVRSGHSEWNRTPSAWVVRRISTGDNGDNCEAVSVEAATSEGTT